MNQIKWIQLGVIAICIATVPSSPAQTPRIQTSGNNQTTTTAPRLSISSGNSTRAPQIGINPGSATNIGVTTNAGAHTTTNAGAQIGIQAIGITRAAAQNSISRGNSMASTQNEINIATSTNTTANTNTAAETSKGAGAGTGVKKLLCLISSYSRLQAQICPRQHQPPRRYQTPLRYHPPRSAQVRPRHHKLRIVDRESIKQASPLSEISSHRSVINSQKGIRK